MVAHRKTPSRKAYVLPGWFFGLATVVVVLAAAGLVWVAVSGDDSDAPQASPTTSATPSSSPSATRTPSPTRTTPSPSATPTKPSPSPTPTASRTAVGVSVLNGSRTAGLARSTSLTVQQRGWTVSTVGNWRAGGVAQSTVFYPVGREAEGRLLAQDLGLGTVAAALPGMSTSRLTVVVLGPVS